MNNKKKNIFLLFLFFLTSCSFDSKTGIWSGSEEEQRRILELERAQNKVVEVSKIYTSDKDYNKEVSLIKNISLSKPKKNSSWDMVGLNYQNYLGNIYLSGSDNIFLKKKIGKNKFSLSKTIMPPLVYDGNIIFSDDTGTIFNVNEKGKINWKKNIYEKIYKKIYKKLILSIYKNKIYISDNIGFIYSISLDSGKLIWIKNHGIPFKSNIKIFDNKIFLVNQDNRIICFSTKDGSKVWDIRSISSFIKSEDVLSLALSKQGNLIVINSAGDLFNVDSKTGNVYWSLSVAGSTYAHATDFFKTSNIVLSGDDIIFSAGYITYSFNLKNAYMNWEQNVNSIGTPVIDGENIFIVTNNGFLIILDKVGGKIISSKNILQVLKEKKQETNITGFIMGSGKIYSVTKNGYLITSSAISGKAESYKKIGDIIMSNPIISNGKLYVLTRNMKLFGFN